MKKAMTVLGAVEADQLGHVLPHEHILWAFPDLGLQPMYPELVDQKISLEILGKLRRHIWSCKDNLRLDEPQVALEEIASFKQNGGGTIVDVTPIDRRLDVQAVVEISRQTGVHIVLGTGYYVQVGHPQELATFPLEEIARRLLEELLVGIQGTSIKAGLIGEIGVSSPMTPDEAKVLRAATRVQRQTGAPLSVHQYGGNELIQIDALLTQEGVPAESVILCHMSTATEEQRLWAAERGYYVELDDFGNEYYTDALAGVITRDPNRIRMVKELIAHGHLYRILISNDVALKMLLKRYGGWGYEHIKVNIKPFMLREGIPPKAVDSLLYYNPARAIAYFT